jgi:endonuclease/exonuclease/phosphatase family metal-dependent hydrolase
MRITSWNLLHGMAIPPVGEGATDGAALTAAVQEIGSDVYGFQELDHFLPRSRARAQARDIAEGIGARYWAMGPSVIGTPGESWRKRNSDEPEIITNTSTHQELTHECYGIGIVSKIPVISWHRLDLGNSPIGLPLIVPGDETGKGRPRFIYVKDEPRLALAAVLENGWTVVNTHLSFVPILNLAQLTRLKRWALSIAQQTDTKPLIIGDLNLPKNLPIAFSSWKSLVSASTYPSWGAKIQFDYLLAQEELSGGFQGLPISKTGISDHLPISAQLLN